MRTYIGGLIASGTVVIFAGWAGATTVRFDLVPAGDSTATSVTVAPTVEVPYQIFVLVTSDNVATPDNNGLSFFAVDIVTDLGIQQQPLDSFSALIAQTFPLTQSRGALQGSNILQIGGGQNTFAGGTVVAGIGTGGLSQLIGQGRFLTPTTPGTYSVDVGTTSLANVFLPQSLNSAAQAAVQTGPGFTIVVAETTGTETETTTETTETVTAAATGSASGDAVLEGAAAIIGTVLIVAALFFYVCPFSAIVAVTVIPLLLALLVRSLS